jgi:hypothetical protein
LPEETVDRWKRRRIREAGYELLDGFPLPDGSRVPVLPLRFDIVVVEPAGGPEPPVMRHHRAAF